jgi:hypothetical protein
MSAILLVVLMLGCGGPSEGPAEPLRRPSGVLQPPEDGSGVQVTSETGAEMDVTVEISIPRTADKGTLAFIGVKIARKTEDWMSGGDKPEFFWISPVVAFADKITLKAPLPKGLHFMAVVNQGDGDDLPGPGDLHSDPTPWDGTSPLTLRVDRRYGEARARTTGENAVEDRYEVDEQRHALLLHLGAAVKKPRGKTRLIILGRDLGGDGAGGPPAFFWRTDAIKADWPWRVEAPLPDGFELEVIVDVDGDGMPSAGDLLTGPQPGARPEAGSTLELTLDRRFAMPTGG